MSLVCRGRPSDRAIALGLSGRAIPSGLPGRSIPSGLPGRATSSPLLRWTAVMATALLATGAGCAPAMHLGPAVSPEEVPALERQAAEEPEALDVLVRLGRAYRAAERPLDAAAVLERAVELDRTHPEALANLGLAYEAADRPTEARALYQTYQQVGESEPLLRWIQGRLPSVRRQEMVLAAKEAVLHERELANTPPRPGHVAVLPFRYTGTDPQYEPLGRALAEFLVTDLSRTDRLTVLERARVQVLLDELGLADEGLVQPETAARTGRLLGAEHTVLGNLGASEAEVMLEAAVVGATEGALAGEQFSERDELRRLFDAQKRLALGLYRGFGVELTAAERERVLEHQTESLEALLAFGHGLVAGDRADYAEAARRFRQAAELDPGFREAEERADEAEAAEAAAETGVEAPEFVLGASPSQVPDALFSLDDLYTLIPDPLARDAVADAAGQEGIGRRTLLEILIRRP